MKMNYYAILEVQPTATPEVIRAAYVALAKRHHPDKGGNEKQFKLLQEAYEVLKDDQKRVAYDQQMGIGTLASSGRRVWVNGRGFMEMNDDNPYPGGNSYGNTYPGAPTAQYWQNMQSFDVTAALEQAAREGAQVAFQEFMSRMFPGRRR